MIYTCLARFGRILEANDIGNPDRLPPNAVRFNRGSVQLAPAGGRVHIDHDPDRPIGHVRQLAEYPDIDGHWVAALLQIDNPPEWLREGNAVSLSHSVLQEQQLGQARRILRSILFEVSLLSEGVQPGQRGARLVGLGPWTPRTPAPDHPGLKPGIRRRVTGRVIAIR